LIWKNNYFGLKDKYLFLLIKLILCDLDVFVLCLVGRVFYVFVDFCVWYYVCTVVAEFWMDEVFIGGLKGYFFIYAVYWMVKVVIDT
jgi:hypothetical protein